jgi:hypothetical protein
MRDKTGKKAKKKIQNKINSNKKKRDHIWHINKSKSNIEEWNWKQNSNRKMIKK